MNVLQIRPKPNFQNLRMHLPTWSHEPLHNIRNLRFPILFYKPLASLIGPLAAVTIPKVAQPPKEHLPDYEVELVIVIGKAAKDVSEADALDYVLGYTGANDVSFRKHQMAVSQWGFSKGFGTLNCFRKGQDRLTTARR